MVKPKHKKWLAITKGFRGQAKSVYKVAKMRGQKALQKQYINRKLFKRDMRKTWIAQISAGARLHGVAYRHLVPGLTASGIGLDRKSLADLARTEPMSFHAVLETVKQTGLKPVMEAHHEAGRANAEKLYVERQVRMKRRKPEYGFSEKQRSVLERIEEQTQSLLARQQEEDATAAQQAIADAAATPLKGAAEMIGIDDPEVDRFHDLSDPAVREELEALIRADAEAAEQEAAEAPEQDK